MDQANFNGRHFGFMIRKQVVRKLKHKKEKGWKSQGWVRRIDKQKQIENSLNEPSSVT